MKDFSVSKPPAPSSTRPVRGAPRPPANSSPRKSFSESLGRPSDPKKGAPESGLLLTSGAKSSNLARTDRDDGARAERSFSERLGRSQDRRADDRELAAFSPTLSVLVPPAAPIAPTEAVRALPADLSKFAEQIVTHVRLGRVGEKTELRLGLRMGRDELEVRLHQRDGTLIAHVVGDLSDGTRLAGGIQALLKERGIEAEVEVSDR